MRPGDGPFPGNTSNLVIFEDAALEFGFSRFLTIPWTSHTSANGEAWPAIGHLR